MPEVIYRFNARGDAVWADPDNMIDGSLETFGSTSTTGARQRLNGNTCPGIDLGRIDKVEIRTYAKGDGDDELWLEAFEWPGDYFIDGGLFVPGTSPAWTAWMDISYSGTWVWGQGVEWESFGVQSFDVDVVYIKSGKANLMHDAIVEIRVTYDTIFAPTVTTQAVSNIGATTATGHGTIADTWGENCSKRGVFYHSIHTSPTGNEGTTWTDPTNVYDDDEDSYAISGAPGSTLVLTHAALTCGQIRYLAAKITAADIKIRVYKDGAWETIYEGYCGFGWQTIHFEPGLVTKAEISFTTVPSYYFYEFDFCEGAGISEETDSFGTGAFSRPMTGLAPSTHYYVRAYAYNSGGYGRGNEVEFDTLEALPGYPYHRRTLKGTGPYSGRRGFDETTGHRRGFWP